MFSFIASSVYISQQGKNERTEDGAWKMKSTGRNLIAYLLFFRIFFFSISKHILRLLLLLWVNVNIFWARNSSFPFRIFIFMTECYWTAVSLFMSYINAKKTREKEKKLHITYREWRNLMQRRRYFHIIHIFYEKKRSQLKPLCKTSITYY